MSTIIDEYSVCEDCFIYIVNGDLSGLDFYLRPDEAEKRANKIIEGATALENDGVEGYLVIGDESDEKEFSRLSCPCCGTPLAGKRYPINKLSR